MPVPRNRSAITACTLGGARRDALGLPIRQGPATLCRDRRGIYGVHRANLRPEVEHTVSDNSHWPFTGNIWARNNRKAHRSPEADEEQVRGADSAMPKVRGRHDRLIVGGRAHTKKSGLS
jgi:hypothetical protein